MTETELKFLNFSDNYGSHLPMLLMALRETNFGVVEFGSGMFSTPLLKKYCEESGRGFSSYDNNKEWAEKTGAEFTSDWSIDIGFLCGVLFIDCAPGEIRSELVKQNKDKAHIIVAHDTEETGCGNYGFDFSGFKYRLNHNTRGEGAGTTAVSNFIDITKHAGDYYGYRFDK